MLPSCCAFALLMGVCCSEVQASRHMSFDNTPGFRHVSREKRGVTENLAKLGQAAAEKLLLGTKQLTSPKQNKIRMFEKSGSFDDAVDDFRSANPSIVWEYKTKRGRILEGRVGDRHLLLMSRGTTPTLDITYFRKAPAGNYGLSQNLQKISGQPTDRIIYTPDGKYYNF